MNGVLLCRVSSKDQEETGYSLSSQERLLTSYAERKEFSVSKIYSISESASGRKQRAIFTEMMAYVLKKDIKIIICEKVDRLTRNFKDAVMIDEWLEEDEERQVHLVKDSLTLHKNSRSQEKLNWGIRILFAKNYIDNLSEEVKKGYKEKIEQGWMPHPPPIGYITVGETGHKIHIPDESKAPFIKKMFSLYATGNYSVSAVGEVLYKDGLKSKSGKKIAKSKLHEILKNPFYFGKFLWSKKLYHGNHQPLITEALFNTVQNILENNNTPKISRHNYLFKGMIRCKECKGTITWEQHKGILYGHCNHYRNCTQKTWVKEHQVIKQLVKALGSFEIRSQRLIEWIRKALKDSHKDEIIYYTAQKEELQRHCTMLENRLDKLYEDKIDGKIRQEFYDSKYAKYSTDLENTKQKLNKLSGKHTKHYELGINIYELSQRATKIFKKALYDDKRKLIRLVFSELYLDEGILKYEYTKPFTLLLKAVQATNSSKAFKEVKIPHKTLELVGNIDNSRQSGQCLTLSPVVQGCPDSNWEKRFWRPL